MVCSLECAFSRVNSSSTQRRHWALSSCFKCPVSLNAFTSMEEVHSYPATPFHWATGGQVSSDACIHLVPRTHFTNIVVDNPTPALMSDYLSASMHFKLSSETSFFFGLVNTAVCLMLIIPSVTVKLHSTDRMWLSTLTHNSVKISH